MLPVTDLCGRRVAILGGLGFIGSNLAMRCVALGARTVVVDALVPGMGGSRANLGNDGRGATVIIGDTRDLEIITPVVGAADVVYVLAAQTSHLRSMSDPLADLDLNCRGLLTVLEAWRQSSRCSRIIFASTRQVYGRPRYLPVDEDHPVAPKDVNGVSKAACESYLRLYGDAYGLDAVTFRLTNTYGPRMPLGEAAQGFVGTFISRALSGDRVEVYGKGDQLRDFCYVDDVVEALVLAAGAAKAAGNRVYNLGSTEVRSVADFVDILHGACSFEHVLIPFPAECSAIETGSYYTDFQRFSAEYGWSPVITLEEGLRRTVSYCRERLTPTLG